MLHIYFGVHKPMLISGYGNRSAGRVDVPPEAREALVFNQDAQVVPLLAQRVRAPAEAGDSARVGQRAQDDGALVHVVDAHVYPGV